MIFNKKPFEQRSSGNYDFNIVKILILIQEKHYFSKVSLNYIEENAPDATISYSSINEHLKSALELKWIKYDQESESYIPLIWVNRIGRNIELYKFDDFSNEEKLKLIRNQNLIEEYIHKNNQINSKAHYQEIDTSELNELEVQLEDIESNINNLENKILEIKNKIQHNKQNKILGKSTSLLAQLNTQERRLSADQEAYKLIEIKIRNEKDNIEAQKSESIERTIEIKEENVEEIKSESIFDLYLFVENKLMESYSLNKEENYLNYLNIRDLYFFIDNSNKGNVLKHFMDKFNDWHDAEKLPTLKELCQFLSGDYVSDTQIARRKEKEIKSAFNTKIRIESLKYATEKYLNQIKFYLDPKTLKHQNSGIIVPVAEFENEFNYLTNCLSDSIMKHFSLFVSKMEGISEVPWIYDDIFDNETMNKLLFSISRDSIKPLFGRSRTKYTRDLYNESEDIKNKLISRHKVVLKLDESLEINENFIQSLNSLPTVSIAGHHSALGHDNRSLPTSKNNLLKETQSKSFCINFGHLYLYKKEFVDYLTNGEYFSEKYWDEICAEANNKIYIDPFHIWYQDNKESINKALKNLNEPDVNNIEMEILYRNSDLKILKEDFEKSKKKRGNENYVLRMCLSLLGYQPSYEGSELETRNELINYIDSEEELSVLKNMFEFVTNLNSDFIYKDFSDVEEMEYEIQDEVNEIEEIVNDDIKIEEPLECKCYRNSDMEILKQSYRPISFDSNDYVNVLEKLLENINKIPCNLYSDDDLSYQWMENKNNPMKKSYKVGLRKNKKFQSVSRLVVLTFLNHAYGLKTISKYIHHNVVKLGSDLNNSSVSDWNEDLEMLKILYYDSEFSWEWPND